mmetsp:Transcript_65603/g.129262  ORF Transcript_65603/g.129262 Transcript_65603/m.129262 type:complete len:865 (-) Transcript_65603:229-2823(-)
MSSPGRPGRGTMGSLRSANGATRNVPAPGGGSARGSTGAPPSPSSPKRAVASPSMASPPSSPGGQRAVGAGRRAEDNARTMSRVSSCGDCPKDVTGQGPGPPEVQRGGSSSSSNVPLFRIVEQLAAAENALWNILDSLKSSTTHASFFCREYWGSSASQAQVSLDKLNCNERLKRQVQQACMLESLSLAVASHLCSGVMQGVSVTTRSRLRNMLYYIHENCLVLLDMVCQRWMLENQGKIEEPKKTGHCPENLNLDILVRVKRYRRLRRGEHVMALRQHNEMIVNVVRQLCRGSETKRAPLTSRGDQSPGVRSSGPGPTGPNALTVAGELLTAKLPFDRLRPGAVRSKMLQYMCFFPLLNSDGAEPDCPWPTEDPYVRYGAETFGQDGPPLWYEPLPPMLPNLDVNPLLPPQKVPGTYTLVLDLDETLVHYYEIDGLGTYDIRPGMYEFIERMHQLGYEIVIFTAATQDYADWVIDQIDPNRFIHYRLYRQHALPWGPIFVKDLNRVGRHLDRTLIIDNVQENFMLQPHNGIFICTWYDDPHDTALFALTPLLEELLATCAKVPEVLDKYREQIPTWAGFDQFSQYGADYSEFDIGAEENFQDQFQENFQDNFPSEPTINTPPYPGPHSDEQPEPTPSTSLAPAVAVPQEARAPPQPMPLAEAAPENKQPSQEEPKPKASPYSAMVWPTQPAVESGITNTSPVASFASRYQPHASGPSTPQFLQSPPQAGYPAQPTRPPALHQHQQQQQSPLQQHQQQQQQQQQQQHQPQHQPKHHQQHPQQQQPPREAQPLQTRQPLPFQTGVAGPYQAVPPKQAPAPRPAFSASGVAGPYQAAPARQPQPVSAGVAMWGRPGVGGPYQVTRR